MSTVSTENWKGLVLAGGKSSRMGRDKATMLWNGRTMADHARYLLLSTKNVNEVWISRNDGQLDSIPDQTPEIGPLGGLQAAFYKFAPDFPSWVLLLPVDMPLLKTEMLETLQQAAVATRAVHFKEWELPAAILADEFSLNKLNQVCSEPCAPGVRSLRNLFTLLQAETVSLPMKWESSLLNINTFNDFEKIKGANYECTI